MIKTTNRGVQAAIEELLYICSSSRRKEIREVKLKTIRDQNARDSYIREKGKLEGKIKGQDLFATLTQLLLADNRNEDLIRATRDKKFRQSLFKEYYLE